MCGICQTRLEVRNRGREEEYRGRASVRCPRCQTVQEPDSLFCFSCGLPLNEEEATSTFIRDDQSYRPLSLRALWVEVTLVIFGLIIIVSSMATFAEIDILQRTLNGELVSSSEINTVQSGRDGMYVLFWIGYVATAIVFLFWIYRASKNLHFLNAENQQYSPRWSVIWWFVPLACFYKPYQVMNEIWKGSDPNVDINDSISWEGCPRSPLLIWWWATWIMFFFLGDDGFISTSTELTEQGQIWEDLFILLGFVTIFISAVLLFVLVRKISQRQEEKHQRIRASSNV